MRKMRDYDIALITLSLSQLKAFLEKTTYAKGADNKSKNKQTAWNHYMYFFPYYIRIIPTLLEFKVTLYSITRWIPFQALIQTRPPYSSLIQVGASCPQW